MTLAVGRDGAVVRHCVAFDAGREIVQPRVAVAADRAIAGGELDEAAGATPARRIGIGIDPAAFLSGVVVYLRTAQRGNAAPDVAEDTGDVGAEIDAAP